MKKNILVIIGAGFIYFSTVVLAQNEAWYYSDTGVVSIPKVIFDGSQYQVDMQQTDDLNFKVTNVSKLAHESTANGTYELDSDSKHLIFYWQQSTFERCGPRVRDSNEELDERAITLSANTQIWHTAVIEGGINTVWSRKDEASNSIIGTWTAGASQITFNSDNTVVIEGTCL